MSSLYERWGVELGSQDKWAKLVNRLIVIAGDHPNISKDEALLLAFKLGSNIKDIAKISGYPSDYYLYFSSSIRSIYTPFELAEYLDAVLSTVATVASRADLIIKVVNNSGCGVNLKRLNDGVVSFPAGEKLLDEELVETPLSFLEGNPLEEYKKALKNFRDLRWEECSEKIRRTLEEYIRSKLDTTKGLKGAIPELGKKLKYLPEFPAHLQNTLVSILHTLDINFNEASKHQSKTFGEAECEFLIYQAGLIMRFLNKIEFSDAK